MKFSEVWFGSGEYSFSDLLRTVHNPSFDKINENVGVNRAPVRIRHSGRVGDSGRDIFEKENLITRKIKEINRASPGFGLDSPIGADRARGSLQF